MKKLKCCIFLFAVLLSSASFGQKFSTDGYWAGVIPIKDDYQDDGFALILYIEDGKAREVEWKPEEDKFFYVDHDKETHTNLRNNMSFTWMNEGGAWSETQSFMLSTLNEALMRVLWTRQVTNEEDAFDNSEWNVIREGYLAKMDYEVLASFMRE